MNHSVWRCFGLAAGVGLIAAGSRGAGDFWLVRDGQPAATLVVPASPLQVVQSAAEELQHHIKLVSGACLPIVTNRPGLTGNLVRFGAEAARVAGLDYGQEPNAWIGRLRDGCLVFAGDDSLGPVMMTSIIHNHVRKGTLFAVYDFLENHLGIRWLWPGDLGTVAPPTRNIVLGAYERRGKPAFYFSRFRDGVSARGIGVPGGWASVEAAHRFHAEQAKWLLRHRFAMPYSMNARHSFTAWWEQYGEAHPEYFNLLPDGTRRSDPFYCNGQPQYISMCVSNPDLHREIVANWLQTRHAAAPFISAGENDTSGKCTCPRCLSWDVPDPALGFPWEERLARARAAFKAGEADWWKYLGSLSDRYARFYQSILDEARKHDPDVLIMGLAYANYVKRPLKFKLSSGVVFFVTVPQYYPFTEETRQANRQDWLSWAEAGGALILRPNYMLEGGAMPLNLARYRGEDFKFFADHSMIGNDFDSLRGQFGAMGLTLYATARLNDKPSLELEAVFEEYYRAFGPATNEIRAYFDFLAHVAEAPPQPKLEGGWWAYGRFGYRHFTPSILAKGRGFLERAGHVARDDDVAVRRIAFLEKGLRHAELIAAMQQAFEAHKAGTRDLADVRAAVARLVRFRGETEADLIGNYGWLYDWETRFWNIPSLLKGLSETEWKPPAQPSQKTPEAPHSKSGDCGQTFVLQFAGERIVDRVGFRNREKEMACKDIRVSLSRDGVTFHEVIAQRLFPAEKDAPAQTFSLPAAEPARYLRLDILSGYEASFWSLRDFEAWSAAEDGNAPANLCPGAELVRWTSDYGCHAYFANSARMILDGDPESCWVSAPLPTPCASLNPEP